MLLRKDDPWMVELSVPDARGWRVVDTDGNLIGYVEEMAVERAAGKLEAILTGPNERFPAGELEFGEGVVTVLRSVQWRVPAHETRASSFTSFEDAFSDHFRRIYSETEYTFGRLAGAYRFGRRMAGDGDYLGLTFEEAEEGLRAAYSARGRVPPYHAAREAVRFAYELTRGIERAIGSGRDRVDRQVLNPKEDSAEQIAALGSFMAMGDPESRRPVV